MNEKRTVKCLRQVEHIKKGIFFAEHIKQFTGRIYLYIQAHIEPHVKFDSLEISVK
jgi:hypothetical protein